jgi:hypothetical protein
MQFSKTIFSGHRMQIIFPYGSSAENNAKFNEFNGSIVISVSLRCRPKDLKILGSTRNSVDFKRKNHRILELICNKSKR